MPSLSRRQFLTQAATVTGLASCSSLNLGGSPRYIDAHSHIWTPDTHAYPLAHGFTKADMQPPSFTPDQLFHHCRPEGVDRVVLIQMSFYRFDNRYMLDMIASHPGVFRGVAIVDENKAGLREHMRELARHGVRGFRIHKEDDQPLRPWLASKGMAALWQAAADENLAVCPLIDPQALPLIDGLCERFPQTKVVIDHFARIGRDGPVTDHQVSQLCRLSRHAHVHVKTSAFYALGKRKAPYLDLAPMIRRLRDAYGAQRLMWASDCPFQVDPGYNYHDSIALIRDRLDFLTPSDKRWMLRGTAEKVFFS